MTVGSDPSFRLIQEKLPKSEVHGQNPIVLSCNKQSLTILEGSSRKDTPNDPMPPMGVPQRKNV